LHQSLLQAALHEISAMQDHFMMLGCKSAVEKVTSISVRPSGACRRRG
jgi:CRP/FNR family transcriptional regulator